MAIPSSAPQRSTDIHSAPTRARYITIVFAMLLAIVTYIDRVCISQAAPLVSQDLGLTKVQMAWAFSVFGWAYALFEIPGGWLADRLGPAPRAHADRDLVVVLHRGDRVGLELRVAARDADALWHGRGRLFSEPHAHLHLWLPHRERERAQANLWLAARWGGAFTPLLVTYVLDYVSWRRAFELFGLLGLVWAIAFYRWFRDDPRTHPSVNAAELALLPPPRESAIAHGPTPWGPIMTRRHRSGCLACSTSALSYGWYFYVTWLPTYLREARGTSVKMGAVLAGLPLLLGGRRLHDFGLGDSAPCAGRRHSVGLARRIVAIVGFVGASASIFVFTTIEDPDDRDDRARHRRSLQRLRHAGRLGRVHGRRRPLLRHRVRLR